MHSLILPALRLLQVRTLFVSGLPMDTKPRELYLLFRAYEVSMGDKQIHLGQTKYTVAVPLLRPG